MKRTLLTFAALGAALALAACGASGNATLTYGDPENPTRVTAVSGLKSRDAANMANQGAYFDAQIKRPQRAVCSLKARDNQTISLSGISEFTCWAPATDDDRIAQPQHVPTEFAENIRAAGAATREVLGAAVPIVGIQEGAKTVRNGQDAALASQRVQADVAGQGIDAAGQVVFPPVYAPPGMLSGVD